MARGRRLENWDHTAHLLAKIHNVNCTKSHQLRDPLFFHLLRRKKGGPGAVQATADFHRSMCAALTAAEARES